MLPKHTLLVMENMKIYVSTFSIFQHMIKHYHIFPLQNMTKLLKMKLIIYPTALFFFRAETKRTVYYMGCQLEIIYFISFILQCASYIFHFVS